MTSQWPPQHQQYQQAPQYQQPPQYQPVQQYHQSQQSQPSQQYQPPQQYQQAQQYQAPQQYQQAQQYQPPHQYQQSQQYQQAQQYQQVPQYQQAQYQQPNQYSVQQPQNQQTAHYQSQNAQVSPHQYQQPPQQWSQPQHYQQQGQQYAQAGQNNQAQAQTYQQHPQPRAQQQGNSEYQQQQPVQQYHPQQFSTQQQSSPQHVAYQQPYQQPSQHSYQLQSSPTGSHVPIPVTPNLCYNCGNPNHLAQDCPAPKRAIPVGALGSRNFSKILQRPKSSIHAVNNSSPLHSGGPQAEGHPQGYPSSSYGSNGPVESQVQQSPVTPAPAQSLAHQQAWQQYWHWQASQQQQQSQHQQHPAQVLSYSQQNNDSTSSQASGHHDYHQQPSSAHPQAHPYRQAPQVYPLQIPQGQNQQTQIATEAPALYDPQRSNDMAEEIVPSQRQTSTSSVSIQSQPMSASHSKQEETAEDVDEIDLDSLDVPDLPEESSHNGKRTFLPNTVVSPPVSLIGMPLPANFIVADALYPILPPAPETQGRCQSKYLRDNVSETLCTHIRQSRYWKDLKDDTAFLERPNEEDIVPVGEIRAQIKQRYIDGEAPDDQRRQSRSESRNSFAFKKDSADTRTRLEQLEIEKAETLAKIAAKEKQRALKRREQVSPSPSIAGGTPGTQETTVKDKQTTPIRSAISEISVTKQQSTEDVLAALGVTGSPKPVIASRGAYNVCMHDQPNGARTGPTKLQGNLQSRSVMSYSPDTGPPPPPPLPVWQQSLPQRANDSPSSSTSTFANGHIFDTNGAEAQHGYHTNGADAVVAFPKEASYEQSSVRKRSFNRRDSSSSEEDTPARRQEDDVTPKFKRHQPKVAAAYSRRW